MRSISIMSYFAGVAILAMSTLGALELISFNVLGGIAMYFLLKEVAELFFAYTNTIEEE